MAGGRRGHRGGRRGSDRSSGRRNRGRRAVTRRLHPSSEWTHFTVLLIADPAAERSDPATDGPTGRREALVALARAVFAAGGPIALRADPGVALVIATVGLEYAAAAPPSAGRKPDLGRCWSWRPA